MKCALTGETITNYADFTKLDKDTRAVFGAKKFASWYHAIVWALRNAEETKARSAIKAIDTILPGSWPAHVPAAPFDESGNLVGEITAANTHPRFYELLKTTKTSVKNGKKAAPEPTPAAKAEVAITAAQARPYLLTYLLHIPADSTKVPAMDIVTYPSIFPTIYANHPNKFFNIGVQPTIPDFTMVAVAQDPTPNQRASALAKANICGDVWMFCHTETPSSKCMAGTLPAKWKKFVKEVGEMTYSRRTKIKAVPPKHDVTPME